MGDPAILADNHRIVGVITPLPHNPFMCTYTLVVQERVSIPGWPERQLRERGSRVAAGAHCEMAR